MLVGLDDQGVTVTNAVSLDRLQSRAAGPRGLFRTLTNAGADAVAAVVFTDQRDSSVLLGVPLAELANQAGLELIGTVLVSCGRWWWLGDAGELASEGRPLPSGPTAIDAAAVYGGLTALSGAQAITDLFTPLAGCPDLEAELEAHRWDRIKDGDSTAWDSAVTRELFQAARAAHNGTMPSDQQVARFGVALQIHSVLDALWMAVDDHRLSGLALWINLARRLPDRLAARPLFLAAWTAYREGDGGIARAAARRALGFDAMLTGAALLLRALDDGVDPRSLPTVAEYTAPDTEAVID